VKAVLAVLAGLAAFVAMFAATWFGMNVAVNHFLLHEYISDTWVHETPGVLRLDGTEYRITAAPGEQGKCLVSGPREFSGWAFSLWGCKVAAYRHRKLQKDFGL
jgi:hypothetical protein